MRAADSPASRQRRRRHENTARYDLLRVNLVAVDWSDNRFDVHSRSRSGVLEQSHAPTEKSQRIWRQSRNWRHLDDAESGPFQNRHHRLLMSLLSANHRRRPFQSPRPESARVNTPQRWRKQTCFHVRLPRSQHSSRYVLTSIGVTTRSDPPFRILRIATLSPKNRPVLRNSVCRPTTQTNVSGQSKSDRHHSNPISNHGRDLQVQHPWLIISEQFFSVGLFLLYAATALT